MAGAIDLDLVLGGTIESPALELSLEGRNLVYAGRDLQRLTLRGAVEDLLQAPAGLVEGFVGPPAQAIALSAGFNLQGKRLGLSDVLVQGPEAKLHGQLAVDLDGPRLDGRLQGEVGGLAALEFWHGVAGLAGSVELDARLQPGKQGQALDLRAVVRGLSGGGGTLAGLDLKIALADLFGQREIDAVLSAQQFRHAQLSLDRFEVKASGRQQDLRLSAAMAGVAPLDAQLETRIRLRQESEGMRIDVEELSGSLMQRALALERPALVRVKPGVLGIRDFDLKFGEARISASGDYAGRSTDVQARVQDLPLELLSQFGGPSLHGRLTSRLALEGTAQAAAAELELDVVDLVWTDDHGEQLPPSQLKARARLAQGELAGTVELGGFPDVFLRGSLTVPARLSLEPFAFGLAEQVSLRGSLNAKADLARVTDLLELDTHSVGGHLRADLAFSGSLDRPGVTGDLELVDGSYEHGGTGTLLRDIQIGIEARGREIVITRLSATDGASGKIGGRGRVSLEQTDGFPHQVGIDLELAELVRRDDASAVLSGSLTLEGSQTSGSLGGQLTVNQAEIRIPDRLGPDVPELDVIEVNDRDEEIPERAPRQPPYALAMDLQVNIPGRTFVRGRGLESEWEGTLKISGPAETPRVLGSLSVRRGYFNFLDRRFELRKGIVDFHGNAPPVPHISMEAEAAGHEMTGVIILHGPANSPKLTLESEPSLPQDEILARLLFDRHLEEISAFQALSLAAAVRSLTTGGTDLMGQARGSLGLDALDFRGDGGGSGAVKAGKYLREDIFLEVESGIGETGNKARVEWELTPNISVESSVDEKSNSAFGINWKLDY